MYSSLHLYRVTATPSVNKYLYLYTHIHQVCLFVGLSARCSVHRSVSLLVRFSCLLTIHQRKIIPKNTDLTHLLILFTCVTYFGDVLLLFAAKSASAIKCTQLLKKTWYFCLTERDSCPRCFQLVFRLHTDIGFPGYIYSLRI